jgi:hypothetical protein
MFLALVIMKPILKCIRKFKNERWKMVIRKSNGENVYDPSILHKCMEILWFFYNFTVILHAINIC